MLQTVRKQQQQQHGSHALLLHFAGIPGAPLAVVTALHERVSKLPGAFSAITRLWWIPVLRQRCVFGLATSGSAPFHCDGVNDSDINSCSQFKLSEDRPFLQWARKQQQRQHGSHALLLHFAGIPGAPLAVVIALHERVSKLPGAFSAITRLWWIPVLRQRCVFGLAASGSAPFHCDGINDSDINSCSQYKLSEDRPFLQWARKQQQ
ncbi:hypothetical protein ISCGN_019509 [Ixodes scapularis]